jgi:cob(I)alamin adenosyltransferase
MVHVYTGDGKGKTTAALGLALRAVGRGFRVAIVQFLKAQPSGERAASERLHPDLVIHAVGRPGMVDPAHLQPEDTAAAKAGLDLARNLLRSGEYQLVVLDEVCVSTAWGLLAVDEVVELVKSRPPGVEIVLTGRQADERLLALADYVTEMRSVKHPFERGVAAREGIEW